MSPTILWKRRDEHGEFPDLDVCGKSGCKNVASVLYSADALAPNVPPAKVGLCDECPSIIRKTIKPEHPLTKAFAALGVPVAAEVEIGDNWSKTSPTGRNPAEPPPPRNIPPPKRTRENF